LLSDNCRAEWSNQPSAIETLVHQIAYNVTKYLRTFTLDQQPRVAQLRISAAKRFQLKINGSSVDTGPLRNWKNVSTAKIAPLLRTGTNVVEVRVFNDSAPPALWLALTIDGATLQTDRTWEASVAGSSWRPVVNASAPR